MFPGYNPDLSDEEFDRLYKDLIINRFKYQQEKDTQIYKKLSKFKADISRLGKIATLPTGSVDLNEAEEKRQNQSDSRFSKKKKSGAHQLKPIDVLREEIKDDIRFKEMYDDIVK